MIASDVLELPKITMISSDFRPGHYASKDFISFHSISTDFIEFGGISHGFQISLNFDGLDWAS